MIFGMLNTEKIWHQ